MSMPLLRSTHLQSVIRFESNGHSYFIANGIKFQRAMALYMNLLFL